MNAPITLDDDQRAAVAARWDDGYSAFEIAADLSLDQGACISVISAIPDSQAKAREWVRRRDARLRARIARMTEREVRSGIFAAAASLPDDALRDVLSGYMSDLDTVTAQCLVESLEAQSAQEFVDAGEHRRAGRDSASDECLSRRTEIIRRIDQLKTRPKDP